jgi:hypothetical protein
MAYRDMARSHVVECTRKAFELSEVTVDGDGDLPMRYGTAMYFLSIRGDGRKVKAWSPVVGPVKGSAALLRELNEVNAGLLVSRVFWGDDQVVAEGMLPIEELTPELLRELCVEVGQTADSVGSMVSAVFGGSVSFSGDEGCPECGA